MKTSKLRHAVEERLLGWVVCECGCAEWYEEWLPDYSDVRLCCRECGYTRWLENDISVQPLYRDSEGHMLHRVFRSG